MNALELLKADHKVVDGYFQEFEATDDESKQRELFEKIAEELTIHAHLEEKIFYPALLEEGDEELQDIVKEGIEEHHLVKQTIREISNLAEESEKLEPKLTVLAENTRHHVMEEEGEMFQMVEEQLDAETLEELGAEMEAEKKAFASEAAKA
jgi:iron-sulfur cluster repair protein YtfE (RIC family)